MTKVPCISGFLKCCFWIAFFQGVQAFTLLWAGLVISILPSIPFPFPTDFIRTVFNHFNQCDGCLPVSPSVRRFTAGWSGFSSLGSGFHLEAGCQYWKLLVVLRHPTNLHIATQLLSLGVGAKGTFFWYTLYHPVNFDCLLSLQLSLDFSFHYFTAEWRGKSLHFICYILLFFSFSVSPGQKVTDHILFATPGTMLDWIFRHKAVEPRKIKMFVLDDADAMIAIQGHQDQSIRIHK